MSGRIKRAFYDASLGQIHYRFIRASAEPKKAPVIFLHQSASCGWCYETMMKRYAGRGHDCYAPDMPGFGNSFDPTENPTSTRYYVDIFIGFFRHLNLPKVHLVGHHTGAALSMEMAAVYPDEILTVALSGPALATSQEQAIMYKQLCGELSKPKEDGSHLTKVWHYLNGPLYPDLETKNHEVLDTLRAWKGRDQSYACSFKQDKLTYFSRIVCPILAMCSKEDVLWSCFHYCQELQPHARCEVTTGDIFNEDRDVEGSIPYYQWIF